MSRLRSTLITSHLYSRHSLKANTVPTVLRALANTINGEKMRIDRPDLYRLSGKLTCLGVPHDGARVVRGGDDQAAVAAVGARRHLVAVALQHHLPLVGHHVEHVQLQQNQTCGKRTERDTGIPTLPLPYIIKKNC